MNILDYVEPLSEYAKDAYEQLGGCRKSVEPSQFLSDAPEMVTNLEMADGIANYFESEKYFRLENWIKLSLSKREELLNYAELHIAAIEHRPASIVKVEKLNQGSFGYQCADEHKIALNSLYVGLNNPGTHREVLDTIVHEGRHAYQRYNVEVKTIHESVSEVASWRENFHDPKYMYYHSGNQMIFIRYGDGTIHDVDYRLYYYQPVEIDARNFAADVLSRLEKKGVLSYKTPERSEDRVVEGESTDNIMGRRSSISNSSFLDSEILKPSFERQRSVGFDNYRTRNVLYGESHIFSRKNPFQSLSESENRMKAYNEILDARLMAYREKSDELMKRLESKLRKKL